MIPWFRISYFKNIRKLHCNFLFLSIHDITWKCSWLFKYSANSKSSAINANCLGESAAPSFNSRDAPAATSIQQIVLLLYAAALCNAVWPVHIYKLRLHTRNAAEYLIHDENDVDLNIVHLPFSLSTISRMVADAFPIKNLIISLCPNRAP